MCVAGPAIKTTPTDLSVAQLTTATFMCSFTGKPIPSIQWRRMSGNSSTLISTSSKYFITNTTGQSTITSMLTILNTNALDIADYVCEASNAFSSIQVTAHLTVNGMIQHKVNSLTKILLIIPSCS